MGADRSKRRGRSRERPLEESEAEGDRTIDYVDSEAPWNPSEQVAPTPVLKPEPPRPKPPQPEAPAEDPPALPSSPAIAPTTALPPSAEPSYPPPAPTEAERERSLPEELPTVEPAGLETLPLAPIDPRKALPRGWKFLKSYELGLIGSLWAAREPRSGFRRTVKILGYGELPGTFVLKADAAQDLREFVLPWNARALKTPAACVLESPVERLLCEPFVPHGEDALRELGGIANALHAFHRRGYSFNLLAPPAIAIHKTNRGPRPLFIDYGLSLRATMADLQSGRVPSPALTPANIAFWAPEVIEELNLLKPTAGFHPERDVYFLALATIHILWGRLPFSCDTLETATDGHEVLPEAVRMLELGEKHSYLLLKCLDKDPRQRMAADNFISMLKSPKRREALWACRRSGAGVLTTGATPSGGWAPDGPAIEIGVGPTPRGAGAGTTIGPSAVPEEERKPPPRTRPPRVRATSTQLRLRLRAAAYGAAGTLAVLLLLLGLSWNSLVNRSPSLAHSFGYPIPSPALDATLEDLHADQEKLWGSQAHSVREYAGAAQTALQVRAHCDWIWLRMVPRWRAAQGARAESLRMDIERFLDGVEKEVEPLSRNNAFRSEAASLGRPEVAAYVSRARQVDAKRASFVARLHAAGKRPAAATAEPEWIPPAAILGEGRATLVARQAQARIHLLRGTLRVASKQGARTTLEHALRLDGDLIEALLERGRLLAETGTRREQYGIREEIRKAFPDFERRHVGPDRVLSERLKRAADLRDDVLQMLR